MKIIKSSNENMSKYDMYELTQSNAIQSMKKCEDRRILEVDSYLLYEDTDRNGNDVLLLSILDELTGDVFVSQSATFQDSFCKALDYLEDGKLYIRVLHATSKAGRQYINCAMVSPKIAERELK